MLGDVIRAREQLHQPRMKLVQLTAYQLRAGFKALLMLPFTLPALMAAQWQALFASQSYENFLMSEGERIWAFRNRMENERWFWEVLAVDRYVSWVDVKSAMAAWCNLGHNMFQKLHEKVLLCASCGCRKLYCGSGCTPVTGRKSALQQWLLLVMSKQMHQLGCGTMVQDIYGCFVTLLVCQCALQAAGACGMGHLLPDCGAQQPYLECACAHFLHQLAEWAPANPSKPGMVADYDIRVVWKVLGPSTGNRRFLFQVVVGSNWTAWQSGTFHALTAETSIDLFAFDRILPCSW